MSEIAECRPELDYLKDPSFHQLSADLFGSHIRLPIAATIYELTPKVGVDYFVLSQVVELINGDRSNTHRC